MLDDLIQSLQGRAEELRAAANELARVEAALAVLQPAPPTPARRPGGQQALVLEAIALAPGSTGAQLAKATGITSPGIYAVLRRLAETGRLRRDNDKRWWPA